MNMAIRVTCLILGCLVSGGWSYLLVSGMKKQRHIYAAAETGIAPLQEVSLAGLRCVELLQLDRRRGLSTKMHSVLLQLYGEEQVAVNELLEKSYRISWRILGTALALLLTALTGNVLGGTFAMLVAELMPLGMDQEYRRRLKEKREEELLALPAVLSKIILLLNAGVVMRDAWRIAAEHGESALCREMRKTGEDISSGMMEIEAYRAFAERTNVREVRHFTAVVTQNLKKGSGELAHYLQDMSDAIWSAKYAVVKEKTERASKLLLVPSLMIFAGVVVLVLAPMLNGLNF